jgi:hypothetical protein
VLIAAAASPTNTYKNNPHTLPPDHSMASSSTASSAVIGAPPAIKLKRENYLYWKAHVLPALHGARVMRLLEGSDRSPPEELEVEDDNKKTVKLSNLAYDTWIARDQQVASYLVNSLSEDVLAHVFGLEHAADIWALLLIFSPCSLRPESIFCIRALANTKKEAMTVDQFISKMRGFVSELVAAGKRVDDDKLKDYILNGLDEDYNSLVASINVVPSTTLNEMCSQLKAFDMRQTMLTASGQHTSTFVCANLVACGGSTDRHPPRDDARGRLD